MFVLTQLHILSTAIHLETCKTYFIGSLVSRLVHTSLSQLEPLVTGGQLGQVSSHYFKWMSCQMGKQTILPFPGGSSIALPFLISNSIASALFDLVHFDR